MRSTVRYSYFNPSVHRSKVVFVLQTLFGMSIRVLDLHTDRTTVLYSLSKRSGRFLWTTGISAQLRYFTVYDSGGSWIDRS
jgi:hypothetical protein